jgi:hypothetical protein
MKTNREYQQVWRAKLVADPERHKAWKTAKRLKRKQQAPQCPAIRKKSNQKLRSNLTNAYIAMVSGFSIKDLPQPLIELKRELMRLKRQLVA